MTRWRLLLGLLWAVLFGVSLWGVLTSGHSAENPPLHEGRFVVYCVLGVISLAGGAWMCRPANREETDADLEDDSDDDFPPPDLPPPHPPSSFS